MVIKYFCLQIEFVESKICSRRQMVRCKIIDMYTFLVSFQCFFMLLVCVGFVLFLVTNLKLVNCLLTKHFCRIIEKIKKKRKKNQLSRNKTQK